MGLACLLLALPVLFATLWLTPQLPVPEDPRTEKSKRLDNPYGHPDEFAKYFAEIEGLTTGYDPYPHNYKMMEFQRAYEIATKRSHAKLNWMERGPGNVGGRTRAIVIDPTDPTLNTWYLGAVGGGVWKARRYIGEFDQERIEWTPLTDHLPSLAVSAMAMSASNPEIIYVGTGEGFGNLDAASGVGIFKTTDGGENWTQLAATTVPADNGWRYVNRIQVSPADPDVVVVATNGGIYRTTNGGESFQRVYSSRSRVQDLQAHPDRFNVQFAAENSYAVLRSTDGGQTWEESLSQFPTGSGRIELAIAPTSPNVVYASVDAAGGELYRTTDGGDTWMYVADAGETETPWLRLPNPVGQGWYDNTIAVHPFSPDTVYLGGIQLWKAWILDGNTAQLSVDVDRGDALFMQFVSFSGANAGPNLFVGAFDPDIPDITTDQLANVEVRFGQGTQKAHRFVVSGMSSTGLTYSKYIYRGYVEVPFQVWDTDNNRQLTVSFRDQADNGVFDLIHRNTAGKEDMQSREYVFIHHYNYNENAAHALVGANGGVKNGMMYFYWPYLEDGSTWDPDSLPTSIVEIATANRLAELHEIELWEPGARQVHVDHHNLTILPIDAASNEFHVLNGNDGGVGYSRNSGESWIEADAARGFNTSQFYDATKRPNFNIYLGGTQDNGTWRSYNNANSSRGWLRSFGGDGFDVIWTRDDDVGAEHLMGSIQYNEIRRSLDGGRNWEPATNGLDDVGRENGGIFISSLGWSELRPEVVFAIGRSGVWRSQDFGGNWQLIPMRPGNWGFSGSGKVRVSLASPEVVWAGFRMRSNVTSATVHLSRDGGTTFNPVDPPDFAPTSFISGLATHPWQAQTAYVMFSVVGEPKLLRTTDYGQTWEDLSGFANSPDGRSTNGFPDARVYDVEVFPEKSNIIWAGTDMGLFESRDHGESWYYADNGLPAVSVWRIRIVDGEIVLATHGRGVWTLDLTEVLTHADAAATVPAEFTFEPNYPNPFNPTTTIGFQVPYESHIRVTVFDVLGRQVATLVDQPFAAGAHQVDWNAANMASGQYFYRMEADGQLIQTLSMVLVK